MPVPSFAEAPFAWCAALTSVSINGIFWIYCLVVVPSVSKLVEDLKPFNPDLSAAWLGPIYQTRYLPIVFGHLMLATVWGTLQATLSTGATQGLWACAAGLGVVNLYLHGVLMRPVLTRLQGAEGRDDAKAEYWWSRLHVQTWVRAVLSAAMCALCLCALTMTPNTAATSTTAATPNPIK